MEYKKLRRSFKRGYSSQVGGGKFIVLPEERREIWKKYLTEADLADVVPMFSENPTIDAWDELIAKQDYVAEVCVRIIRDKFVESFNTQIDDVSEFIVKNIRKLKDNSELVNIMNDFLIDFVRCISLQSDIKVRYSNERQIRNITPTTKFEYMLTGIPSRKIIELEGILLNPDRIGNTLIQSVAVAIYDFIATKRANTIQDDLRESKTLFYLYVDQYKVFSINHIQTRTNSLQRESWVIGEPIVDTNTTRAVESIHDFWRDFFDVLTPEYAVEKIFDYYAMSYGEIAGNYFTYLNGTTGGNLVGFLQSIYVPTSAERFTQKEMEDGRYPPIDVLKSKKIGDITLYDVFAKIMNIESYMFLRHVDMAYRAYKEERERGNE